MLSEQGSLYRTGAESGRQKRSPGPVFVGKRRR
nr:MAG TPA: hypothetical protein [Caudoviricetes sp.]